MGWQKIVMPVFLCKSQQADKHALNYSNAMMQRKISITASHLAGMAAPKGQEVVVVQREMEKFALRAAPFTAIFGSSMQEGLVRIMASAAAVNINLPYLFVERPSLQHAPAL